MGAERGLRRKKGEESEEVKREMLHVLGWVFNGSHLEGHWRPL